MNDLATMLRLGMLIGVVLIFVVLRNFGGSQLAHATPGAVFDVNAGLLMVYEDEQAYRRYSELSDSGDYQTISNERSSLVACSLTGHAKVRLLDLHADTVRIEVTSGNNWGCHGYVSRSDLSRYGRQITAAQ